MIRVICPGCSSRLNAKDEIAGQVRKCPKCGHPMRIPAAGGSSDPATPLTSITPGQHAETPQEDPVAKPELPRRINRNSSYLICGRTQLVAMLGPKSQGWMVKADAGMVAAKRNRDRLPSHGDYKLVELRFEEFPEGKRLTGLYIYQLATSWALTVLDQADGMILDKITGRGALNKDQKFIVRQALKDLYMRPVWDGAAKVLEYLGNADAHSHSIEEVAVAE